MATELLYRIHKDKFFWQMYKNLQVPVVFKTEIFCFQHLILCVLQILVQFCYPWYLHNCSLNFHMQYTHYFCDKVSTSTLKNMCWKTTNYVTGENLYVVMACIMHILLLIQLIFVFMNVCQARFLGYNLTVLLRLVCSRVSRQSNRCFHCSIKIFFIFFWYPR